MQKTAAARPALRDLRQDTTAESGDTQQSPVENSPVDGEGVSAAPNHPAAAEGPSAAPANSDSELQLTGTAAPSGNPSKLPLQTVSHRNPESSVPTEAAPGNSEPVPPLHLADVVDSVVMQYPLLRSAMFGRNIARGELLQANGEFDLKLKAETLNNPLGFYENYRHSIGAEQPLFGGGTVFGGYRLGNGDFPTYYGERATKTGGEFKAGALIPLAQNRNIDDRRAGLWRGRLELQAVEPEIQAQLISFVQAASIAYWNWVAAGYNVQIARDLLKNATDRNEGLEKRVQTGDAPRIELTDNQRLIVSRQTKLIDAERKFRQSAFKLSLFLRDESGRPVVIDESRLPSAFPAAADPSQRDATADTQLAIGSRPELRALSLMDQQLRIDLRNARNLCRPQFDAVAVGSQDVGAPSDPKKDDKSPFEMEAGVLASVPLQRRKAIGKQMAVEGKLAQIRAKTQFTQDKIVAEVQSASVALNAAWEQLEQAHQALELARQMEVAERRKFELGDSNLLLVNLREQATADAATIEVEARLNFFTAEADFAAALGATTLSPESLP